MTSPSQSPQNLITQYVLECKGKGNFLPYVDYQLISGWLKDAKDVDELLLVLSDVLPDYFGDDGKNKQLSGVDKRVKAGLKERAMRR